MNDECGNRHPLGGDVQHGPGSSPFPALSGLPERVSSASSNEAQPANRSFVTSNAACHYPLHEADIAPGSFFWELGLKEQG
jgi:hypothetical protein